MQSAESRALAPLESSRETRIFSSLGAAPRNRPWKPDCNPEPHGRRRTAVKTYSESGSARRTGWRWKMRHVRAAVWLGRARREHCRKSRNSQEKAGMQPGIGGAPSPDRFQRGCGSNSACREAPRRCMAITLRRLPICGRSRWLRRRRLCALNPGQSRPSGK